LIIYEELGRRVAWLAAVPEVLQRQSRATVAAAVGGFAVFIAYGVISGGADQETWVGVLARGPQAPCKETLRGQCDNWAAR
jgi:hypothetical protein